MGNLYFSFDAAAGACRFGCSAVVLHRELQSAASGLACPQPLFTGWPAAPRQSHVFASNLCGPLIYISGLGKPDALAPISEVRDVLLRPQPHPFSSVFPDIYTEASESVRSEV